MGRFGIGQPVQRLEDNRFLTGRGRYLDDIELPHQQHAYVLRSPHAHARLRRLDAGAARAMPGVALVLAGSELAAEGVGTLMVMPGLVNRDGSPIKTPPRSILATDRVRYVGDSVALVVAASLAQARDAAEAIEVEYEPLPSVTDTAGALAHDAPQVWSEAPGNVCVDWEIGDAGAVEKAFAKAAHVARLDFVNNRVVAGPMETRGAIGLYDPGDGRYTLYTSSQGSHGIRDGLAKDVLKIDANRLRVITPDVGGGFGMKAVAYPEQALVLIAARKTGRPVKWIGERSDAFLTDTQGRDHATRAELALDKDGRFLALRVSIVGNLGAYLSQYGPYIPTAAGCNMLTGLYTTPAIHAAAKAVFTNTTPTDAYRGAGRPEAAYAVERMVDVAAREIGLSAIEIRRRNYIPPAAMPYRTPLGDTYDSGDFARNLDDALRLIEWDQREARQQAAKARGRRRGFGIATYVESSGGWTDDMAEVRLEPSGAVAVVVGTVSNGQGHETAFAQIIADTLGVPIDKVRLVQGDTDQIPYGNGTGGSRSLPVQGNAVLTAARRVVAKGRHIAGALMETAESDIEFADGVFTVAGTDKRMTIGEVAAVAYDPKRASQGIEFGLAERANYVPRVTYPNGCHIAEVEVDVDTGVVDVMRYVVVDDFGKIVNPLLLAGQVHGGTAQGIGQALYEHCVYDGRSGQLLSGSFMDYRVPRAADLPSFVFATNEVPCRTNPMGIKGAGEAGAIGAPPAIINAIVDALAEYGVRHIDMPATPERVWRAIRGARA